MTDEAFNGIRSLVESLKASQENLSETFNRWRDESEERDKEWRKRYDIEAREWRNETRQSHAALASRLGTIEQLQRDANHKTATNIADIAVLKERTGYRDTQDRLDVQRRADGGTGSDDSLQKQILSLPWLGKVVFVIVIVLALQGLLSPLLVNLLTKLAPSH